MAGLAGEDEGQRSTFYALEKLGKGNLEISPIFYQHSQMCNCEGDSCCRGPFSTRYGLDGFGDLQGFFWVVVVVFFLVLFWVVFFCYSQLEQQLDKYFLSKL